jgi:hypothetical protein
MFKALITHMVNCCMDIHDTEKSDIIENKFKKKRINNKKKNVYFNEDNNKYYVLK